MEIKKKGIILEFSALYEKEWHPCRRNTDHNLRVMSKHFLKEHDVTKCPYTIGVHSHED